MKRIISVILVVALSICLFACQSKEKVDLWANAQYTEDTVLGNGATTLYVDVVTNEKTVTFTIKTDKETVGEALIENNLVSGEKGAYGLYVKFVNGIEADYDKNQSYWAFTKGGESLMTGVDGEKIEADAHYELTYTK